MESGWPRSDLRVRRGSPSDAEAITNVFLAARLSAMPWLPIIHSPEEVTNWLANYVMPFSRIFVAELDGAVIGFATLRDNMLEHLYVRPEYQRHGIGSALLETMKMELDNCVRLYTHARNTLARRFYEKHGFRASPAIGNSRNEERELDILLELEICSGVTP